MVLKIFYNPRNLSAKPCPWGGLCSMLLSEVEQGDRGNGDREAIVVEAGLCDGKGERAYTVYDPILGGLHEMGRMK